MIQTIRKAWGIPELRKKIIFTLLILLIFRLGNAIMVPYINRDALALQMQVWGTGLLGLYNVMSGGAFGTATVFALSIQTYINSSIIIQLLTVAIPALERLARDGGEEGKKKIQSITRYATVAIAILQAIGYYFMMKNYSLLEQDGIWVALVIIVKLAQGGTFGGSGNARVASASEAEVQETVIGETLPEDEEQAKEDEEKKNVVESYQNLGILICVRAPVQPPMSLAN